MRIGDVYEFEFDGRRGKVDFYDASTKTVYWADGAVGGGPTNVDEMIDVGRFKIISLAADRRP